VCHSKKTASLTKQYSPKQARARSSRAKPYRLSIRPIKLDAIANMDGSASRATLIFA
jgi:hypothetical protein